MEQENHEANPATPEKGNRNRSRWLIAGGVAVVALAGIGAAGAMGGGETMGRHVMEAGMKHGGHFAGRGLSRALDAVNATAEQEDRIWAIIDDTRAELRPVMREFRDTRETVMQLMAAPTIDRAAAETLRAERIAAIDEASKKMTAAMLDAAEVLTPEQRAELAKHLGERKGPRRW
ncbi:MAG: Spy/CpxP family protein refolding chaperone [Aquamicrobium sp.]|uniref:Spy/CpxP family protein refolding chaperone n=1 Tax=Aquamicrobium sp. TaxID=1872579 RepID=UPI00349E674B|nr:Spy/CpxP family protein refolding chaperone [Aquamicrobium sp.]